MQNFRDCRIRMIIARSIVTNRIFASKLDITSPTKEFKRKF